MYDRPIRSDTCTHESMKMIIIAKLKLSRLQEKRVFPFVKMAEKSRCAHNSDIVIILLSEPRQAKMCPQAYANKTSLRFLKILKAHFCMAHLILLPDYHNHFSRMRTFSGKIIFEDVKRPFNSISDISGRWDGDGEFKRHFVKSLRVEKYSASSGI